MIKRMASKLHLGQPKHPDSSASSAASSYTSSATSVSILSHEHHASISTQRTSLHEWVKDQAEALQQERPPQSDAVPLEVRRSKGSYRLTDFIIQRTLGTGSFGRVHLGELLDSCLTLPTSCEEICLSHELFRGDATFKTLKWALRSVYAPILKVPGRVLRASDECLDRNFALQHRCGMSYRVRETALLSYLTIY